MCMGKKIKNPLHHRIKKYFLQEGGTKLYIIIAVLVLIGGYLLVTKIVLPRLLGGLANTITTTTLNNALNFDFTNAQTTDVNQLVTASNIPEGLLLTESINQGEVVIDGNNPNSQITGTVKYLGQKPIIDYSVRTDPSIKGKFGAFNIKSVDQDQQANQSIIHLPTNIETGIILNLGAGKATINLTNLNTPNIRINAGAGSVSVTFSNIVSTTATLNTGAGILDVYVPKTNAVKIIPAQGIPFSNLNLGDSYEKIGDTYQTKGYDQAKVKTELNIAQGIGKWNIHQQ